MHPLLILCCCAASTFASSAGAPQGLGENLACALVRSQADQSKPPPLPAPPASKPETKFNDQSGAPVLPGVLPQGTAPAARDLWQHLCQASLVPGAQRIPVSAFDLNVNLRYKADENRTNDFGARYRFLAPGFVRSRTANGREHVRGPQGDWFIDEKLEQKTALEGRENAEDRRQIDETVSIARNFIALTDPSSLRILGLRLMTQPPAVLPVALRERASKLSWLELKSPDFYLNLGPTRDARSSTRVFRVELGVVNESSLVEQALVQEDLDGEPLRPSSAALELTRYKPADGFLVPRRILLYSVDEQARPVQFQREPNSDIVIDALDLRADLKPSDFLPG